MAHCAQAKSGLNPAPVILLSSAPFPTKLPTAMSLFPLSLNAIQIYVWVFALTRALSLTVKPSASNVAMSAMEPESLNLKLTFVAILLLFQTGATSPEALSALIITKLGAKPTPEIEVGSTPLPVYVPVAHLISAGEPIYLFNYSNRASSSGKGDKNFFFDLTSFHHRGSAWRKE